MLHIGTDPQKEEAAPHNVIQITSHVNANDHHIASSQTEGDVRSGLINAQTQLHTQAIRRM